jgi:hypothetical protein
MSRQKPLSISGVISQRIPFFTRKGKRSVSFSIDKRQKFVFAVVLLTIGLFLSEFQFGKSGVVIAVVLSVATDLLMFWSVRSDLKESNAKSVFILPFFYSLAFGLFYFLIPARIISRVILSILYGVGLYSLFLSQNIFIVGSIRTIQLLSGARIVSFVLTLLSFFFLSNTVFSLHLHAVFSSGLLAIYSLPLLIHSLWTYDLQQPLRPIIMWATTLTICLVEVATLLWFWPSSPTVMALFLTGFFYTIGGLSHVWLERRLFRGVLWEYLWVGAAVFFVLLLFTQWGK